MMPGTSTTASLVRGNGMTIAIETIVTRAMSQAAFGVMLIAVDDYTDPPGRLPSSRSADRFAELVTGETAGDRHRKGDCQMQGGVEEAFGRWLDAADGPPGTIVYLVGHGETRQLDHSFLVPGPPDRPHARAKVEAWWLADQLYEDWRRRVDDTRRWTLLILDCCASETGVANMETKLSSKPHPLPRRYGLWPVTASGASHNGEFVRLFAEALGTFTENDDQILLRDVFFRIADRRPASSRRASFPGRRSSSSLASAVR